MVELNKQFTDDKRYINQLNQKLVDETIVLYKPRRSNQRVTKHYELVDGIITVAEKADYIKYFTHERKKIQSFADIISMLDNVQNQFAMLGEVKKEYKQNLSEMRRLKNDERGVFDYRKQTAFFDLDHLEEIPELPNPTKSQQDADDCVNRIQSYMPLAMRRASKVTRFSSSTGLSGNKRGLHMLAFLDEVQSEATLRELQKGIDRFMKRRIFVNVPIPRYNVCDSKIATYNQPLYISPPVVGPGIVAPFSTFKRHQFRPAESQFVCVAELRREIELDDALYAPVKAVKSVKQVSTDTKRRQIREAAPAIFADDSIIDIAFARSQKKPIKLAQFMEENGGEWTGDIISYRNQCFDLYRCNVLDDAIKLINVAGNLSGEADLNDVLTILVSLAVKKLPLAEITEERVIAITQRIASLVFDYTDVAAEKTADWIKKRKYCSILSRAVDAADGNKIIWVGRKDEDRRYGYSQARVRSELIAILGDGAEELIREHGLSTLFDGADKQDRRRRDNGRMTRDEYLSSSTSKQLEREILTLSNNGLGIREISRIISDYWQVDLTESSVRRRLRRVRTSTDTSDETACHSLSLEDVTHSLTSRTRDNEIVNITNTTDNLEDSCDLSFFDSPLESNESHKNLDYYSKCDPDHLVDQKDPMKSKEVTASNNVIDIKPIIAVRSLSGSNKDVVSHLSNDSKKTSVGHVENVWPVAANRGLELALK